LLAFIALLSSAAMAQPGSGRVEDQWVTSRAFATAGATARNSSQLFPEGPVNISGGPPRALALHLSGVVFPRKFFGVGFGLRSDLLGAQLTTPGANSAPLPQQTVQGSATAVLRWQPALFFGLEGHLGWWAGRAALIRPGPSPSAEFKAMTGPVAGLTLVFDVTSRFTAQLSGRFELSLAELVGFGLSLGAQLRFGLVELGPFDLGLAVTLEGHRGGWQGRDVNQLQEGAIRFGIGPSLVSRRPASPQVVTPDTVPTEVVTPDAAPSLIGKVTRPDSTPVVDATVSVAGKSVTTDDTGGFALEELPAGPVTVTASAPSFRSASQDVVIAPGVPVEVTLVLEAKTGPGSISGIVRETPDKPLAGARVTSGSTAVMTSAAGQYSLEQLGPGAVRVRVTLDGYMPADEVVQVAPESNGELDVTLELATQRSKAKIRGVVSSAAGPVATATVRIVELKLKQPVKADGRFEAEVLGGTYTLIIEAAKHVKQTRIIEVADGDQAIFQIELEKAR
jgi:hypothetical protein